MSSFANLPTVIGLPQELSVGSIDPIMPPDSRSNSIRVYASNNPTVTGSFSTGVTAGIVPDIAFPQTEVNFDIPCSQSSDTFIDTRLSTISFRAIITTTTAGIQQVTSGTLRSSAYAYFDNFGLTGQSGQMLENFNEYGLVADTLIQGQMSNSDREGLFNYGFKSNFGSTNAAGVGSQSFTNTGHDIDVLTKAGVLIVNNASSYNYSIPLLSGVIGVLSERFFPIGLTRKLVASLTTAAVLPYTIVLPTTANATPSIVTVQLTDFFLNLETVKIGESAMSQILSTLPDGKMYLNGMTYKTTTTILPANTTGSVTLPIGLTGSSVRSLFVRFHETGVPSADASIWGKYDSKCPNLNQYGWSIGGIQEPPSLYNPVLFPGLCWRSFLMAMGTFNSSQFKSGVTAKNYHVLVRGGNDSAPDGNQQNTQDAYFSTILSSPLYQSSFLLGENLENIPRRGIISGRDLTFQKVNLILGTNAANTNTVNCFVTGLLDTITIVDVRSGEVQTIL